MIGWESSSLLTLKVWTRKRKRSKRPPRAALVSNLPLSFFFPTQREALLPGVGHVLPPLFFFSLSIRSFFSLFFFFSFFSFLIGSPVCVKRVRSSVRVESTPPPLLLSSLPSSFFSLHHRRRVQRDWPASPIDAVNLIFLLYYTIRRLFFWPSLVFKIFELVVPRSRQTMSFSKMLLHHGCCTWLIFFFIHKAKRWKLKYILCVKKKRRIKMTTALLITLERTLHLRSLFPACGGRVSKKRVERD